VENAAKERYRLQRTRDHTCEQNVEMQGKETDHMGSFAAVAMLLRSAIATYSASDARDVNEGQISVQQARPTFKLGARRSGRDYTALVVGPWGIERVQQDDRRYDEALCGAQGLG
jgi:hypothetical protein